MSTTDASKTGPKRRRVETRHLRVYRYKRGDGGGALRRVRRPGRGRTRRCSTRCAGSSCNRDPSLSLRHSCLHASCGTCGVQVDGREELACVCSLAEHGDEITRRAAGEPADPHRPRRRHGRVLRALSRRAPDHPRQRGACPPRAARRHHPYVRLEDCIECGLCVSACPVAAPATGFVGPAALVAARRAAARSRAGPTARTCSRGSSRPEGVWQCTTCMACVERCPAGIEPMGAIVDMRRMLVEQGDVDPLLQQTLQNFAMQGNSYGKSARTRARWTKGLDFTIPDARKEPVEYVWFVGDFASFDERVQRESQTARPDPARRRRVLRAAVRGRAQRGQRRPPGRRAGPVRDARRAEHGRLRRRAVRGDLHHRSPFAEHAAQRLSAVWARQARVPLHRAARRARRARAGSRWDPARRHTRHLPRPVLSGAVQRGHRRAAQADRGDGRRARRDAAPRHRHVLLRRRRRSDLEKTSPRPANARASSESARRRPSATSTTSSSRVRRTWPCTQRPRWRSAASGSKSSS